MATLASKEWVISLLNKVLKQYNPPKSAFGTQVTWANGSYLPTTGFTAAGNQWSVTTTAMTAVPPTTSKRANCAYSSAVNMKSYNELIIKHTFNGVAQTTKIDISGIDMGYILFVNYCPTTTTAVGEIYVSNALQYYKTNKLASVEFGNCSSWIINKVDLR